MKLLDTPEGREMVRLIDDPEIQAVLSIYDRIRVHQINDSNGGKVN